MGGHLHHRAFHGTLQCLDLLDSSMEIKTALLAEMGLHHEIATSTQKHETRHDTTGHWNNCLNESMNINLLFV